MSRTLGQSIIVENASGAGGTIGALRIARAAPDGYRLLMGNLGTHAASMVLYPNRGYDPVGDFEPIGLIASLPLFVGAKKSLPVTDFKSFIAHVKTHQKSMNYGSAGIGSSGHMVCHFMNQLIGVEVQHVPYRASGQALTALLAGDIDYVCDAAGAITEQIASGNVRGVVVSARERLAALPDMPTSAEQGLPAFQAVGWNMLFAPKGTPPEIVGQAVRRGRGRAERSGVSKAPRRPRRTRAEAEGGRSGGVARAGAQRDRQMGSGADQRGDQPELSACARTSAGAAPNVPAERAVEIGQIAEADLAGERREGLVGELRIGHEAMRARGARNGARFKASSGKIFPMRVRPSPARCSASSPGGLAGNAPRWSIQRAAIRSPPTRQKGRRRSAPAPVAAARVAERQASRSSPSMCRTVR